MLKGNEKQTILNPLNITALWYRGVSWYHYGILGFKGGFQLDSHYAKTRKPLGQQMYFLQSGCARIFFHFLYFYKKYIFFLWLFLKGELTLRLFSPRLVTEAGKFGLPIGRLYEKTNRQPEFLSLRQLIDRIRFLCMQ